MPSDAHTSVSLDKYTIILSLFFSNFLDYVDYQTRRNISYNHMSQFWKQQEQNHCIGQIYYHIMAHTVPKLICHKLTFEQYLPILVLVKLKTHLSRNILHLDHIHVMCFSLKAKLKLIPLILRNILIFSFISLYICRKLLITIYFIQPNQICLRSYNVSHQRTNLKKIRKSTKSLPTADLIRQLQ